MAFPVFSAAGARWAVQYTTRATWAGSDGQWDGYSRSTRLEVAGLPSRLASLASVPDVVLAYAKAHPEEEVLGVSTGEIAAPR